MYTNTVRSPTKPPTRPVWKSELVSMSVFTLAHSSVHNHLCSLTVQACSFGTTRLTLVSSPLGTEMRTLSNHTEPYFSSCRIWLATTLTIFDSTWPFCGPTAKYQHMLLSIALNANYMLSPRLYWQLMALEQSCPVSNLIDVWPVLLLLFVTMWQKSSVKFKDSTNKVRDCAKIINGMKWGFRHTPSFMKLNLKWWWFGRSGSVECFQIVMVHRKI